MSFSRPSRPISALARFLAAAALLAVLVPVLDTRLAAPPTASAATFIVNMASDPGDGSCDGTCTLRDAILNAGALAGHDTITFSPAVNTPIVLASALPVLTEALTIDGSGQTITVDGANAYRVFLATAPLTLTALTVQRGRAPNDGFGGGGAYFGSAGTIWGVSFISNTALGTGGGGAYFATTATLSGATFISNTVTNGNGGGAFVGGTAAVTGTSFMTNTTNFNGGGLAVLASATVTGATFISNTAHADGGGIYVFGAAAVTGTTFIRNRALVNFNSSGGGALFIGAASLVNTTFISNTAILDGGGVKVWDAAAISGSVFTGNTAGSGGGVYLAAGGGLTANIFVSNTAQADGGGLYLGGGFASGARPEGGDIAAITGATFTGNRAMAGGGGGAYATTPTAISGSAFRGNSAATSGGGLNVQGTGIIIATSFTTNTATGPGGGARFGGPANLHGTTFGANTAGGNGGGAAFDLYSILTQTTFYGNQTTGHAAHGGGAWLGGGATLTGTTFMSNTAQNGNGGGLWGNGVTVTNTTVTGNQALCPGGLASGKAPTSHECGDGGGGHLSGAYVWVFSQISSNHADDDGGGGYFEASGVADNGMAIVDFRDNSANDVGGGAYLEGIAGDWGRIEFGDNEAGDDGGALFLNQSQLELANAIFFGNSVDNPDGASDLSMSFHGSSLDAKHVTFSPHTTGFRLAVSVGTDIPDEHGRQDTVARLTNTIFHGYDIGVQGQAPTSTVGMTGVLWSSVNTPWQFGNFSLQLEYTGPAAFVDEGNGDHHLIAASAAIDRGVPTGLATDFDGAPRSQGLAPDLGAYEYVSLGFSKIYLPYIVKGE